MGKVIAINGSPRMEQGHTATVLSAFVEGMADAGSDVEVFYASGLDIKPCTCGGMVCWYSTPGECCFKDDMEQLYPKLREAETLILATPVYIPLPGAMQNVINRLCPLVTPLLETREGRTRARFSDGVGIDRVVLVSTGAWWERGNFEVVTHIAREVAQNTGAEFAGALLRPHASLMMQEGKLTPDGETIMDALRRAGRQLAEGGAILEDTMEAISRPLIPEDELRRRFNRMVR